MSGSGSYYEWEVVGLGGILPLLLRTSLRRISEWKGTQEAQSAEYGRGFEFEPESFQSPSPHGVGVGVGIVKRELDALLSTPTVMGDGDEMGMDALVPAVAQCFSVILLGFIAGKWGLISGGDSKGLNTFIGTFSLPALVFLSMAQLDLRVVNWWFLLAVMLAKSAVFFSVILITALVTRPVRLDKAGIYAIFATQSNDFALGYPIIAALYSETHPEYAAYLYLLVPTNLLFLNPIAFTLMELRKQREGGTGSCWSVGRRVGQGVVLNPVVLMTALGIFANLIFSHSLPPILSGLLQMLGSAFSSAALFSLGLTCVGSAASLKGAGLVVPGILMTVKLLIFPLLTREFVSLLNAGSTTNETVSLANFGFLYGTFPTAPGVFVYALHFDVAVELVASGMVACTFISAPLMFVSAKMITLRQLNPRDYVPNLDAFLLDISILGLLGSVAVVVVFLVGGKWRRVPHSITLCLAVSQGVACVGAILWCWLGVGGGSGPALYLQFALLSFGVLSSRIWTACLAATLVFLRCRSLCFVLRVRPIFALLGWGVPAGVTTVLLLAVRQEWLDEKQDPNFQYGETQALVAAIILLVTLIVTVGCLVMQQRYERFQGPSHYDTLPAPSPNNNEEDGRRRRHAHAPAQAHGPRARPNCASLNCDSCPGAEAEAGSLGGALCPTETDMEDLLGEEEEEEEGLFNHNGELCSGKTQNCSPAQRRHCALLLERYRTMNRLTEPEEVGIVRDRDDEFQVLRHQILLLLLSVSMFVGVALCLWTLIVEDVSGIYVELVFLDATLNFGQGFFTFLLFGLDAKVVLLPLASWWRRVAYGEVAPRLPAWEDLGTETKRVSEQFLTYHVDKCVGDIVRDRSWRMESYREVFCGHELVDWLMLVGLARDRSEGAIYANHLLLGRVIRSIKASARFQDTAAFYTFLPLAE